jgi:hypothetical protein
MCYDDSAGSDRAEARGGPALDLVVASFQREVPKRCNSFSLSACKRDLSKVKIMDYAASALLGTDGANFYLADEKISTKRCTFTRSLRKLR